MKATIDGRLFAKAVKDVAPLAARTPHMPVLGCVRLDFADDVVTLTASDLEHSITTSIEATIIESGVVCAPAHVLTRAVGPFRGDATVSSDGAGMRLCSDGAEVSVLTVDSSEFPHLDLSTDEAVPLGDAWERMLAILHHASTDTAKPLCSITVEPSGDAYCVDGYGMGWTACPEGIPGAVIPLAGVRRAAATFTGEVSLAVRRNTAVWTDGSTTVASTLVMRDAINWRSLIPANPTHRLTVDAGQLIDALAVARAVDDHAMPLGRSVRFTFDAGRLTISRSIIDVGTAAATLDAAGDWPEPIAFRPDQLAACVKAMGSDEVSFAATTARRPVLLEGGDIGQIVMPVFQTGRAS